MDRWTQWIYSDAARFGIDPRAADAISRGVEWPGRTGAGDNNTSFGPFMLHKGGALPRGRGKKWAESRAGVDYALRQMASNGARGLRGRAAISAISHNFERPADVPGEVGKAWSFYQRNGGFGGNQAALGALAGASVRKIAKAPMPTADNQGATKKALIMYLLGNVQHFSETGSTYNPAGLTQLLLSHPLDVAHESDSGRMIPIVAEGKGHVTVNKNTAHVINQAKQFLGTPYKWGGSNPASGFDCSGFVQWLYGKAGVKLGRTTYDQIKQGQKVGRKGLKAGDVIFFSNKGDAHHEALYLGNGKFIHAPHTGDVIKISSLSDPYYSRQFAGGRRFL